VAELLALRLRIRNDADGLLPLVVVSRETTHPQFAAIASIGDSIGVDVTFGGGGAQSNLETFAAVDVESGGGAGYAIVRSLAKGNPSPLVSRGAVPGDADCDGILSGADIGALARALFEGPSCASADANDDGVLSAADIVALISLLVG
jgi:hypothetical protein